jgi:phage gp36-like protein
MGYTALSIVLARFPALETAVGTGEHEVTSIEVSSVFVYQADGLIDGYLSQQYLVPFDANSIHPLIERISTDIVICDLVRDRLPQTPEYIINRCDAAMALLEKLREGDMTLPGVTLANTTGDNEVWSNVEGYHAIFSPVLDPLDQASDRDRVESDVDDRRGDGAAGRLGSRFIGTGC